MKQYNELAIIKMDEHKSILKNTFRGSCEYKKINNELRSL